VLVVVVFVDVRDGWRGRESSDCEDAAKRGTHGADEVGLVHGVARRRAGFRVQNDAADRVSSGV